MVGQWLTETRDIYADWRRLFGGERAVAYYDAITLRAAP
jgi:hypothetical protein